MKLLIDKQTKQVKAISNGVIDFNSNLFDLIDYNLTQTDLDSMQSGDSVFYKDNEIELQSNPLKEKAITTLELKSKIDNAKDINELKELIKQLI